MSLAVLDISTLHDPASHNSTELRSDAGLSHQALCALTDWRDPLLDQDLDTMGCLVELQVTGNSLYLQLQLNFPADRYGEELRQRLEQHLLENTAASAVHLDIDWVLNPPPQTDRSVPGVKHLIAVASGKGGVGKSTTAVNLALALASEGARVGILDADLYGPSQPRMLGVNGLPETRDGKLIPKLSHGLQIMSIGFLVDEQAPVIWRGPMITQALNRLLYDTQWQDLDYLIVDLPPGTGDIHLTMAQKIPVSGAVIVTTPQDIALLDALKGMRMFETAEVPMLGIVENMSTHICSGCGREEHIFGEGGAQKLAEQFGLKLLGELPLDLSIRLGCDTGIPTVAEAPDGPLAQCYRNIARRLTARLANLASQTLPQQPLIVSGP